MVIKTFHWFNFMQLKSIVILWNPNAIKNCCVLNIRHFLRLHRVNTFLKSKCPNMIKYHK